MVLGHDLEAHGADTPYTNTPPTTGIDPHNVPLELMTSPANRRLLGALQEAHAAALAVDQERGWEGDGLADMVSDWLHAVEQEVHGAIGKGLE